MRVWMALACVGLLAACANDTGIDNTPAEVAAAAYVAPGPKSITLMTMINNRTGSGGHTALVVNGMTPKWIQGYKSSHARSTYHVVSQELQVSNAQAEQILQLVMSNGQVAGAFCANATSDILTQVQGFESISKTFYPAKLSEQFASLPGVQASLLAQ